MNKEELIGKLHMIYAGDRNALEEMVGYYDGLKQGIEELQQENKQLKDELKNNPDTQITLQDDKGNKFMVIQTERIDMQVELNKTIEKLFNNWNKLKEWAKDGMKNSLHIPYECELDFEDVLDKMQQLERSNNILKEVE